mgnify:CR=1 FL=1
MPENPYASVALVMFAFLTVALILGASTILISNLLTARRMDAVTKDVDAADEVV